MSYACKVQFRLNLSLALGAGGYGVGWVGVWVCPCARAISDVGKVKWVQERSRCYGVGRLFHLAETAAV